jgi:hypothetical protein
VRRILPVFNLPALSEEHVSEVRNCCGANWQFKTADARVKLKRLYPQFG